MSAVTTWAVTADDGRVRLTITGWWGADADATGCLVVDGRNPVGLVEKLLDALTDDERAGVRQYLGGAK